MSPGFNTNNAPPAVHVLCKQRTHRTTSAHTTTFIFHNTQLTRSVGSTRIRGRGARTHNTASLPRAPYRTTGRSNTTTPSTLWHPSGTMTADGLSRGQAATASWMVGYKKLGARTRTSTSLGMCDTSYLCARTRMHACMHAQHPPKPVGNCHHRSATVITVVTIMTSFHQRWVR